ncbi:MAG TPA: NAD(P)/FAD-dependent oxidoreductase [Chitinophagaceae bacterium]
MQQKNITIIGAGLVGSLLSIYLSRRGHKVRVYERRSDMRNEAVEAGRSINLALSDRGINALKKVGIADDVLSISIPMPGRLIHNVDGSTVFQPYGKKNQAINSVSRSELNKKLMTIAEQNGVEIFFNQKCSSIDWAKNEIVFEHNLQPHPFHFQILFGADGAFSATRLQHMLHHEKFDYQQYYIDCGYKELSIPPGTKGDFLLEKNALHIWPRKEYMLIALPNNDGSFTGTLFFPFEGELSFKNLDTAEKVSVFFNETFSDTVSLIPDLTRQFFNNPVSSLVTVKCFPWVREDKFALIGDAAHALVPFFGQGMNCGFEDCLILDGLMATHGDNWHQVLNRYQRLRKPDADAIADMAVNNFFEMREKTADPVFLLQKKIEASLHEKFPGDWIPAYSQVTFSPQIRYSEAMKQGQKQEAIMQEFMKRADIYERWNDDALLNEIIRRLQTKE